MRTHLLLLASLSTVACAKAQVEPEGDDVSTPPDAEVAGPEAPDAAIAPDADDPPPPPPPAAVAAPLVLTEVSVAPSAGEFVEIGNPTDTAVDLSRYYLSDVPTYFRLPAGGQSVATADVIARFPAGAMLAPGEVVVVAFGAAAGFTTATGVAPDYSIADGTMTVVATSGAATLTNDGELIALFFWDGTADLVTDVDLLVAGVPTGANGRVSKNAVALDGPDSGAQASTYKTDADTLPAQAAAPAAAMSTKRILLETGHESQGGAGNGAGGQDETSEVTTATWDATHTAPTPGTTTLSL